MDSVSPFMLKKTFIKCINLNIYNTFLKEDIETVGK